MKYIERKRRRGLGGLLLLVLLLLGACDAAEPQQAPAVLQVGVVAPFSGEFEPLGRAIRDGLTLAVEDQNAAGGVLGFPVQLVLEDSACDFQTARTATQRLIEEYDIQFVIGAVCADASEGVAQVAAEAGVLQISPASVDADLTLDMAGELRPLIFRVPAIDPAQGTVAAQFALERLGAETAAILYAENSAYGQTLAGAFVTAFEAGEGEIVTRQTYEQDAELFFDTLEKIRDAEPDLVYAPGYHNVMNRLVMQAREFGILVPILGSDGWDSPDLETGVLGESYYTTQYYADTRNAEVSAWHERFESRYLTPPNVLATLSYDAGQILFQAIAETGVPDPTLVAQTMEEMEFDLLTGALHFDRFHNPVKLLPILAVTDDGVRLDGYLQAPEPPPAEEVEVGEGTGTPEAPES